MSYNPSSEYKAIIATSRELSIQWHHGFVHYDHLFAAMLQQPCLASRYFSIFRTDEWAERIRLLHATTEQSGLNSTLPLTVHAESVVVHSQLIAGEDEINSIHLLLSILSFDNIITDAFCQAGILYEDIAMDHWGERRPATLLSLQPVRKNWYTRFSNDSKSELYHYAFSLFIFRRWDECISVCSDSLSFSSETTNFRYLLAYAHIQKRDFNAAIPHLEILSTIIPVHKDYLFSLSYAYDETGRYKEAATILDHLLEDAPNDAHYLNNKGFNLFREGRFHEAIPFFECSIKQLPTFAYPLNNLGFSLYRTGGAPSSALALIDQSLALDKGNSFAYKHKGIICMEQGDRENALLNLQLALQYRYTEKYGTEVLELLAQVEAN